MSTIKAGTTTTTAFSVDQDTTGDLNFQAGSVTPLSIKSTGLVSVSNTASFKLPVGGMASRPASPQNGMMRFNEDLNEVEAYAGNWQALSSSNLKLKLDFDETTTLDSRISFTRATNGTYFNSSGVLTTAGSGVARFDHRLENGSWVNKGLLIEEQRTNLALRSEELNDSYWFKEQTTVTANQTTAPDGTNTADAVFENSTTNFHYIRIGNTPINATNTPHTVSLFVKANGRTRGQFKLGYVTGSFQEISVSFNLSTGTIGSPFASSGGLVQGFSITNNGNGWYRITLSGYTGQNGIHALQLFFLDDSGVGSYAGDITKGMYMWGAQLEVGAFPTSYIATTSASVTRNADVASMTGTNFSSWYNQTEGTVFCQADSLENITTGDRNPWAWSVNNGTLNESILWSMSYQGNLWALNVFDNSVVEVYILVPSPAIPLVQNQTYKAASAYKLNDFAHTTDGQTVGTDTSGTLPTVDRLSLGGFQALNGHIAKFYYWNTRRPNEVLQNLTE